MQTTGKDDIVYLFTMLPQSYDMDILQKNQHNQRNLWHRIYGEITNEIRVFLVFQECLPIHKFYF